MKKIEKMINILRSILIVLLFMIAFAIARYIVHNNAAPWIWISAYWITLTIKNYLDFLMHISKEG